MYKLLVAAMLASTPAVCQVGTIIDSLTRDAGTQKDPRKLYDIYEELVTQWAEANFDSSYSYAVKLNRLANKLGDPPLVSKSLLRLGTPHDYHSHFDSAQYYYEQSLLYSQRYNDSSGIATASFALATLFYFKGDLLTAIQKYNEIEKMFIALGDQRRLARLYNNLGEMYNKTGQYPAAISAFENSLAIKEKINDVKGILNTLANLSALYQYSGDFKKAEAVSIRSVELSTRVHDQMAYKSELLNLNLIYKNLGDNQKSITYLKEAESLLVPGDPVIFRTNCWMNLAMMYLDSHDLRQAKVNLDKVAKEEENLASDALVSYYLLSSQYFEAAGDFKRALNYHQRYTNEQTKMIGEKIKEKTKELEVRYETEKKERQITELELDKQKTSFDLAENRNRQFLLAAVAAGLMVIVGLIYYQYRQKQNSNLQLVSKNEAIAKVLAERETLLREIHHRVKNNLQVISSLLSLQSKNVTDEAAQSAISESRNRVKSMSLIHEQLYQEDLIAGVSMPEYIQHLASSLSNSYGKDPDKVVLRINSDSLVLDVDTAIPIGLILNELISNSLKHAFPEERSGNVQVDLKEKGSELILRVSDDGIGKSTATTGNSFGLSLVNSLMRKLRAEMNFAYANGTSVELVIRDFRKIGKPAVS